jgi:transcription-repair coupling factor (superfamily II helicase)
VGLDTYTRLLEENIRRMREGAVEPTVPAEISLEGSAFLPDAEVRDRYGPLPPEAQRLFIAARLRLLAAQLAVERVIVRGDSARITFAPHATPRLATLQGALHSPTPSPPPSSASPPTAPAPPDLTPDPFLIRSLSDRTRTRARSRARARPFFR